MADLPYPSPQYLSNGEKANATNLNRPIQQVQANVVAVNDGAMPTGTVLDFAGSTAPTGFLICDGSAISRTTYSALFTVLGTTYGVGDGSTTFNIPDCRGRTSIGTGQGSGLTNRTLGGSSGAETHQLSVAELASHTHSAYNGSTRNDNCYNCESSTVSSMYGTSTGSEGSNAAHNNMQPFIVFNKIVKT